MHPILSNQRALVVYLSAWMLLGMLLGIPFWITEQYPLSIMLLGDLPLYLFYAFVCLSSYYLCRIFPLGSVRWFSTVVYHLGAATIAGGITLGVGYTWIRLIDSVGVAPPILPMYQPWTAGIFIVLVLVFLLAVAMHYVLIAVESSRQAERIAFELNLTAQRAEMDALRAQVNPHFLFNSLNSISALTTIQPERAREMTLMLAEFFRTVSRIGGDPTIPLRQELALIRTYLEIEQVRFGDRMHFDISAPENCLDLPIPSLLLQPLVENAVKHGIAQLLGGGRIGVIIARSPAYFRIRIENPFDPDSSAAKGNRKGLETVRRRLNALFGRNASLDVAQKENTFAVEITIPLPHMQ